MSTSTNEAEKRDSGYSEPMETGWERLKSIFTRNEYGESSPESDFISKSMASSAFCGAVTGAVLAGTKAKEDFLRKNTETIYNHPYLAKRKYLDYMILEMSKHGFAWAWRMSLFVGSFVTIITSLASYNNKVSVHHFTAAGAVSGGMFRMNMGIRAIFASSALGAALGSGAGLLIVTGMWATGTTVEEVRYWHYDHWQRELRRKKVEINLRKAKEEAEQNETPLILTLHKEQQETDR